MHDKRVLGGVAIGMTLLAVITLVWNLSIPKPVTYPEGEYGVRIEPGEGWQRMEVEADQPGFFVFTRSQDESAQPISSLSVQATDPAELAEGTGSFEEFAGVCEAEPLEVTAETLPVGRASRTMLGGKEAFRCARVGQPADQEVLYQLDQYIIINDRQYPYDYIVNAIYPLENVEEQLAVQQAMGRIEFY